ncbi:glutathione S-transferase family protein [Roseobacter weihaiensis]|uniref:glutathione S-transferase family protein n=1 Tax=Roseobacter weihaiensis TaxID=2763262 RepID=UPI001D0AC6AB|nr:glutathione S-transferase family protein [Roseobacter sp. H9]
MILYDYILSASCYQVRLMAALLGQPLTTRAVNFHPAKEHKSPEMLKLNPKGTLPVLQDGDLVLTESAEILRYLTRDTPDWRGQDEVWLSFAAALNGSIGTARLHDILSYDADIDAVRRAGVQHLRQLEAHLVEQRFDGMIFLTGHTPTIADIACFPTTALAPDGGVSLDVYPSIRLWMRAIRSLPGFIEMPGIHRLHELEAAP